MMVMHTLASEASLAMALEALKETCTFPEAHCLRIGGSEFHLPFGIQIPNPSILQRVSRIPQAELRVLKSTADPWDLRLSHGSLLT